MKQFRKSKKQSVFFRVMAVCICMIAVSALGFSQQIIEQKPVMQKKIATPQLLMTKGDLAIRFARCPNKVFKPGDPIGPSIKVTAKCTFPLGAKEVAVDTFLTSKMTYPVPVPFAVYSANYSDNVLLIGGRTHIDFKKAGKMRVKIDTTSTIPADTPPGIYYLGISIDAGNKYKETNERNNVHFCKIKVVKKVPGLRKMPDLIVPSVKFEKVKQDEDSQGNSYWIFNVIITVKNKGNAPAGPFNVLLERNVGPSGRYIKACRTCTLRVRGLAPGASITLPPRQFNNANNANSIFRATADHKAAVAESNERNNMNAVTFR